MSTINHGRRAFLRGKVSAGKTAIQPLRPPWALPEADFLKQCTRCGDCVPACPSKIITLRGGYPEVDFAAGACTFCGQCADACRSGALHRTEVNSPPWASLAHANIAHVSDACLAQRGVECRICGEHCDVAAIRFSPRLTLPPAPAITDACTGCGACVAPCPATAISVHPMRPLD